MESIGPFDALIARLVTGHPRLAYYLLLLFSRIIEIRLDISGK